MFRGVRQVSVQGEARPFIRNVFTLGTCAAIAGSEVLQFEKEKDLLERWSEFIRQTDCDMITGYNIMDFDLPYLVDRAHHLKCSKFPYLSRLKNHLSKLTEQKFTSKAFGARVSLDLNMEGRLKFDMLPVSGFDFVVDPFPPCVAYPW